jgi:hypothetical protein
MLTRYEAEKKKQILEEMKNDHLLPLPRKATIDFEVNEIPPLATLVEGDAEQPHRLVYHHYTVILEWRDTESKGRGVVNIL